MKGVIFDLWRTLIRPTGDRFVTRLATLIGCDEEVVTDYLRSTGSLQLSTETSTIAADLWRFQHRRDPPREYLEAVEREADDFIGSAEFEEGAQELIHYLAGEGMRVGIVSNATSLSLRVLDELKIEALIPEIWISCKTGYLKPDPRAFTTVAEDWMVDPGSICVVGDKITTDILGARLSGMEAIWYAPHLEKSHLDNVTNLRAVVCALADVREAVGR